MAAGIDRHVKDKGDKVALLWQGDNLDEVKLHICLVI